MSTITAADAKNRFSELLRRAEHGGERVIVHRHGKPVAAIVSTADLEQLEAADDAADVRDAQAALDEASVRGTSPLETVLRKHGLDHLLPKPATRARVARRTARKRPAASRSRKVSRTTR